MKKKKVYFAGSIRAGRDDVAIYKYIIDKLKENCIVFTEHVGDYSLSIAGQKQLPDDYIYKRDMTWLIDSDFVIAEVSNPSLGVGYELASAVENNIPILCLFRENSDHQLSAMISGCPKIKVLNYNCLSGLDDLLDNYYFESLV